MPGDSAENAAILHGHSPDGDAENTTMIHGHSPDGDVDVAEKSTQGRLELSTPKGWLSKT